MFALPSVVGTAYVAQTTRDRYPVRPGRESFPQGHVALAGTLGPTLKLRLRSDQQLIGKEDETVKTINALSNYMVFLVTVRPDMIPGLKNSAACVT